jgi:hypothetical protein
VSSNRDSLTQRYGGKNLARRVLVILLVVALVVPAGAWLIWATLGHASPPVASQHVAHTIVDDHTATVRVRIQYGDDPVRALCTARAISHDKEVVGEVTVEPDPAAGPDHVFTIVTHRRATAVDWLGCTAEGQLRPR